MSKFNCWKATTALLITLTMTGGTISPIAIPLINPAPAIAQTTSFPDVPQNYWAANFIRALVARDIIAGFPDGTFKPDAPVTRAQFAAMLGKAFQNAQVRSSINFVDVPSNYWAYSAIQEAYQTGFLAGYPGRVFRPDQNIPREQVLVSLANGLNYTAGNNTNSILGYYSDAEGISDFARSPIAAATQQKIVVNYPILENLNPNRNTTRAEVAAFIYQALVSQGQAQVISSQYIVAQEPVASFFRIPTGTSLPVAYEQEKILLTKNETVPVTLNIATNITTPNGILLIPMNSEVIGELQPTDSGTQFVAQQLKLTNGETLDLSASSQVITETETVRKGSNIVKLVGNAAVGTAAAAGISAVTGDRDITAGEVLIGTGAGLTVSLIQQFLGRNTIDLLVVQPNSDLNLILSDDLVISGQ